MVAAALEKHHLEAHARLLKSRMYQFVAREDRPELFDQQSAFIESTAKVAILEGGNGSGKTESAAQKAARFMLWKKAPPFEESTFLVVSDTFSQVANICWQEKLSEIIPRQCVNWDQITWQNSKLGHPLAVPLMPWPKRPGRRWVIEFRSLDQGRRAFQGRRYAGFWFSEQFEWPVFEEVLRGCRETWFDGAHFAEFTPVDADLCLAIEEKQEQKIAGGLPDWEFYRLNAELNTSDRLAPGAIQSFLKTVGEQLYETRRTGAHPHFAGAIYPEFNLATHVIDDDKWAELTGVTFPNMPHGVWHARGIDFGESREHPFVCIWGFKDNGGNWFIYDEFIEDTAMMRYPEIRTTVRDRWPWGTIYHGATYADPSRPKIIMEFSDYDIPTMGARTDVDIGIEAVASLLRVDEMTGLPKLFIHKSCKRLIDEMRRYRWIKSAATVAAERGGRAPANPHAPVREPLKWKDDTCDALRYMIASESIDKQTPTSAARGFDPRRRGVLIGERRRWRR